MSAPAVNPDGSAAKDAAGAAVFRKVRNEVQTLVGYPMKPTTDKRSRLQTVAPLIKNGTVLFPRTGCEELLGQIFNLGVESHDDLCDGLTTLLQGLINQGLELPKIHWIDA